MAVYLEPAKVRERWEKGSKATRKQVSDLWMNTLFVGDEQWVATNGYTGGIDEIPLNRERVNLTMNVLRPRSRGIIGRLASRPLFFQVRPRAADDASVLGAQIAQEVLLGLYESCSWEEIREDLDWVTWLGGTGALCVEWDVSAGQTIRDPETRAPLSTSDGKRQLRTGEIALSALSVAEMTVQPGTRNAERAGWWMKCVAMPPEEAKERFRLPDTPKADAGAVHSPMQYRMLTSREQQSVHQELTLVYTLYERPCDERPEGQAIIVVGEERVEESKWPFPFTDRLNIAVARETKVHGRWMGDSILTAARVPQMALNQSWSSIVEHMKRAGNARGWVNQATSDMIEELTDEPGEYGTYIGPEKPFWLAPPQMPSWWIQQPERLTAFIDEMLGSVEVARGVAPRNVESGFGLSILSENANTPITSMAKEDSRVWGTAATMVLEILQERVTEDRVVSFDEMPELELPSREVTWTGKDFAGQTRATVPLDAIQPRSQAQVQAWAQAQFDRDAIDVRQYARLVQLPEQNQLLSIADPDAAKAQRENFALSMNRPCVPAVFDDHKKHIAVHNAFRKSERYDRLAPAERELVDMHVAAHEQRSIDEQAKASERMEIDPALGLAATANEAPMSVPGEMPRRDAQQPPAGPPAAPPSAPADQAAFFAAGQEG